MHELRKKRRNAEMTQKTTQMAVWHKRYCQDIALNNRTYIGMLENSAEELQRVFVFPNPFSKMLVGV